MGMLGACCLAPLHGWSAGPAKVATGSGTIDILIEGVARLQADAGTRYVAGRGTDSIVGTMFGVAFELNADFGLYSGSLRELPPMRDLRSSSVSIDGRQAEVARGTLTGGGKSMPHFWGIHFPRVFSTTLGALRFTLVGGAASRATLARLDAMATSIRFLEQAGSP